MSVNTIKIALLSATSLMTAACATGGLTNGPQHARTIAEEHPISVDGQVITLTIAVDQTVSDLSNMDHARLRAFADAYLTNGHGPLTVTGPSGAGNDSEGHELSADVRKALHNAGVSWSAMHGATYRAGEGGGDDIILSYTRYVASPSSCGVWKGMRERSYRNLRSPNMGCATMNNYAAMIADPHDLIAPADIDPRDGESVVRAMELFREGEHTGSEIDSNINADTAGQ